MQYAHIRVSSADQNTARQEEALSKETAFSRIKFVSSTPVRKHKPTGVTGTTGQLRLGDTLLVHSIDRLCRNMSDMCAVTTRFRDRMALPLFFLKEQLTFSAGTNNPMQ